MKKFEFPPDLNFRLRIQPPSGKHVTFRVLRMFVGGGSETVQDPALEGVNDALKAGRLTKERARKEVELLVERLYREAGVKKFKTVSNSDNQKDLEDFWAAYYGRRRLVDRESTKNKYRRAVEAVGELSLRTASAEELQAAIDKKLTGNRQREAVGRLHTLLKWLKRGEVDLVLEPEEDGPVLYLTAEELELALPHLRESSFASPEERAAFALLCRVARGTGARIGELFAMTQQHWSRDKKTIFIKHQIRRDGTTALAKSKKADTPGRNAFVLPEARPLMSVWFKSKSLIRKETRLNAANILRAACEIAFKDQPEKHVKFHDLRHSHAIELAQAGVSLLQISQRLGNSERVCQKHYTGFMATDESADLIESKLSQLADLKRSS